MFEDSTFESTGRIKTRSRRWMMVTFAFNGAILITLILIPLIDPDALPSHMLPSLVVAPEVPKPEIPLERAHMSARQNSFSEPESTPITLPPTISLQLRKLTTPDRPIGSVIALDNESGPFDRNGTSPFGSNGSVAVAPPPLAGPLHLPSKLVEGFLIYKSLPSYPPIAKTAHIQGTVVLQATISRAGTIENLRVVSGPLMLQQAALDAVKTWRYRPYLLNQNPVEVETTVSVIFKLEQ